MTAEELRIGNYLHYGNLNDIHLISECISYNVFIKEWSIDNKRIDYFRPISLSNEWCKKFGFEEEFPISEALYKDIIEGSMNFRFINDTLELWGERDVIITYYDVKVHELQNIYYELSKNVLTLNENR